MKSEAQPWPGVPSPGADADPRIRTLIVGVTGDGYVPVVEDSPFGVGRSVIRLPSVLLDIGRTVKEPRIEVVEQLRKEFGYEADELIPMEVSGPPGILLAPLLKIADWRSRVGFVPGVYEVPLRRASEWMRQRRMAGAIESPGLRRGLALAQWWFPRWARARLGRAIGEIEAHAHAR